MDSVGVIAPSADLITRCLTALTGQPPEQAVSLQGRTFAHMVNLVTGPVDPVVVEAWRFAFDTITACDGRVVAREVPAPGALAAAGLAILRHEFAQIYGERINRFPSRVGPAVQAFLGASRQISAQRYEESRALVADHQA